LAFVVTLQILQAARRSPPGTRVAGWLPAAVVDLLGDGVAVDGNIERRPATFIPLAAVDRENAAS